MCYILSDKFPIYYGAECRGPWGGLIILAMVLRHLKAILTFVSLNMFVTLRICGGMNVNVAQLLFLSVFMCAMVRFVLCFIWCRNFCINASGKPLLWAMCRIIVHSFSWRSELSVRLRILSI